MCNLSAMFQAYTLSAFYRLDIDIVALMTKCGVVDICQH